MVDLWQTRVDAASVALDRVHWLDEVERDRAARLRLPLDRTRFINRRAFLREVLATYLGTSPEFIRFRTSMYGRPALDFETDLTFSASHSQGSAVVVVTRERAVGVDIERSTTIEGILEMARQLFHEDEVQALQSSPASERSTLFLSIWTRKESLVKAIGAGLSMPLDGFSVLTPGGSAGGRPYDADGLLPFAFAPLDVPAGYVATVAVAGTRVNIRDFSNSHGVGVARLGGLSTDGTPSLVGRR